MSLPHTAKAHVTASTATASWEALGTSVVLKITQHSALERAQAIVERELAAIDAACSRFRADSELARVNAAKGRPVEVDRLLIEALQVALRAAELTDGDVDPTLGEALVLAGYDRDWRLLSQTSELGSSELGPAAEPSPPPRVRAQVRAGWRTVELDCEHCTVCIPAPIRLDLGATAKAWAADRAARAVEQAIGKGVLVSLGGDIATAGVAPPDGWRIRVTDDHRSDLTAPGQTISIIGGGIATSSTAVRRWQHAGNSMHHIIDPATQEPVRDTWRTVSVAAADCTDANIASTAALVRAQAAPEWLAAQGLPARLLDAAGRVRTVGDWPAESASASEAV